MSESPSEQGSFLFENWRAALQGQEILGAYECPLYSDAWIVGQAKFGPYELINTVAHASAPIGWGGIAPVVVLRVDFHKEYDHPNMEKTDTSKYHGGTLSDELAAISALAMGCRIEAGPTTREFAKGDLRGRPVAYYGFGAPTLSIGSAGRTLPWMVGSHSLGDISWFANWFESAPGDQITLIRAARLYQDAIWIGDTEPALAWLLLVSAIETVAGRWDQSKLSPIERVRHSKPSLVEAIEAKCPELLPVVAETIADTMGATRKFLNFTLSFLPPPPEARPGKPLQITWDGKQLKPILRKIYDYRSRALHDGIPFPAPMCLQPMRGHDGIAPAEQPAGLATRALGGVWRQEDTPMSLHVFEYITRRVLQAWWSSLRQPSPVASS
jgi:hypothetical protein